MAATRATAIGIDANGRYKEVHRLGSHSAQIEAKTWRTFVNAGVQHDGSVYIIVHRDGHTLHQFEIGPEEKE